MVSFLPIDIFSWFCWINLIYSPLWCIIFLKIFRTISLLHLFPAFLLVIRLEYVWNCQDLKKKWTHNFFWFYSTRCCCYFAFTFFFIFFASYGVVQQSVSVFFIVLVLFRLLNDSISHQNTFFLFAVLFFTRIHQLLDVKTFRNFAFMFHFYFASFSHTTIFFTFFVSSFENGTPYKNWKHHSWD